MKIRDEESSPVGSTGYQPVPLGHWPRGMEETLLLSDDAPFISASFPFRSAGCRPAQAGSLCYPFGEGTALSSFQSSGPHNTGGRYEQ